MQRLAPSLLLICERFFPCILITDIIDDRGCCCQRDHEHGDEEGWEVEPKGRSCNSLQLATEIGTAEGGRTGTFSVSPLPTKSGSRTSNVRPFIGRGGGLYYVVQGGNEGCESAADRYGRSAGRRRANGDGCRRNSLRLHGGIHLEGGDGEGAWNAVAGGTTEASALAGCCSCRSDTENNRKRGMVTRLVAEDFVDTVVDDLLAAKVSDTGVSLPL